MEEEKPLTKQDIFDALNQVMPPISAAIGKLQTAIGKLQKDVSSIKAELARKPDRDEVSFMIKQETDPIKRELTGIKFELANKPDREEVRHIVDEKLNEFEGKVRQIVREELEDTLPRKTFRLTEIK
ncbi:MAG: hypothetical protein HQL01_07650 [Nitrospirae bacterium]|nr:hypothetical protein [Nitrospirota bacterium]